ncbi:hypothetical protein GCM10011608_10510 [Micromonospora sonchi]|uniref:Uncharacterized protein n=1 Tax=Micromonospora sonchi TaxID=1763543 RepID=A0A917TLI2_9ACTN|nr:hypothetical protein [Micromonospora sonchi]GGM27587.1 hypothetical protein GCM10011608_10510 [Micromonospora sonchi]
MQATATKTAGQELANTLRRYFKVGTRTRRYRNGSDLHEQMLEALQLASQYPGYYSERTEKPLRAGFGVWLAYTKHVGGYRINGVLRRRITEMSPYQFAAFLGRMVDAGVTNAGQGEVFFQRMTHAI